MKKIIFLFIFICFAISCYAQNLQINLNENEIGINKKINNNIKEDIKNVLKGTELDENEFVVFSGKLSSEGKLNSYEISLLNISNEMANEIMEKLKNAQLLYKPAISNSAVYDMFDLYIGAVPKYEANKKFIVLFMPSNKTIKQNKILYKSQINDYSSNIFYQKLYPVYKIFEEENRLNNKLLTFAIQIDKNGNLLSADIIDSINENVDKSLLSALRQSAPFDKLPSEWNFDTINLFPMFHNIAYIEDEIKKNGNLETLMSNYYIIAKTTFDKRGNVISLNIEKSSNNDLIDKEILNAIKKTNFIKLLKFNNENYKTAFLSIRSAYNKSNNNWKFDVILDKVDDIILSKPINWQETLVQAEKQSKRYWAKNAYKSDTGYKIVALLILNKEGQLLNRSIIKSSGIKEADEIVLKSIDEGAPYPKLPEEFKGSSIPFELTFDYNVTTTTITPYADKPTYYPIDNKPKSKYQKLIERTTPQIAPKTYHQDDILLNLKDKLNSRKNKN